jgi:hypothetical protein
VSDAYETSRWYVRAMERRTEMLRQLGDLEARAGRYLRMHAGEPSDALSKIEDRIAKLKQKLWLLDCEVRAAIQHEDAV